MKKKRKKRNLGEGNTKKSRCQSMLSMRGEGKRGMRGEGQVRSINKSENVRKQMLFVQGRFLTKGGRFEKSRRKTAITGIKIEGKQDLTAGMGD